MKKQPNPATPEDKKKPEAGSASSNIVTPEASPVPLTRRDDTAGIKAKYISLKISDDGSLDLSKMRDKGKAELREAIVKTQRKGELGAVEIPETFKPEQMIGYVSLLMGFEAQIVTKVMKIDADIVAQTFALTPQEQTAIAVPAARVANKYMSDFKYADEMALIGALIDLTFAKVVVCSKLQVERDHERPQGTPAKPNAHATTH